ncbi:MAG: hypothetical protein JWN43_722 [Gammaproteobacteria bacterium]|nr:hypothetical protein [Gammaproteobacteria bacterium]
MLDHTSDSVVSMSPDLRGRNDSGWAVGKGRAKSVHPTSCVRWSCGINLSMSGVSRAPARSCHSASVSPMVSNTRVASDCRSTHDERMGSESPSLMTARNAGAAGLAAEFHPRIGNAEAVKPAPHRVVSGEAEGRLASTSMMCISVASSSSRRARAAETARPGSGHHSAKDFQVARILCVMSSRRIDLSMRG